jgi:hypothetical protein
MHRDLDKFKQWQQKQLSWRQKEFYQEKKRIVDKANFYLRRYYDLELWNKLINDSEKLKFQPNMKSASINYGYCTKFEKDVTFIPNHCQIETQHCFKHRRA